MLLLLELNPHASVSIVDSLVQSLHFLIQLVIHVQMQRVHLLPMLFTVPDPILQRLLLHTQLVQLLRQRNRFIIMLFHRLPELCRKLLQPCVHIVGQLNFGVDVQLKVLVVGL